MLGLIERKTYERGKLRSHRSDATNVAMYRVSHDCMLHYAYHNFDCDEDLSAGEMKRRVDANNIDLRMSSNSTGGGYAKLIRLLRLKHTGSKSRAPTYEMTSGLDRKNPTPISVLNQITRKFKTTPSHKNRLDQLNLILIQKYFQKGENASPRPWDSKELADGYVFQHLPHHLIKVGGEKMHNRTIFLLQDEAFTMGRMASLGYEEGAKAHTSDIEYIVSQVIRKGGAVPSYLKKTSIRLCNILRTLLKRDQMKLMESSSQLPDSRLKDIGHAFVVIGSFLQRMGMSVEAQDFFSEAPDFDDGCAIYAELGGTHAKRVICQEGVALVP